MTRRPILLSAVAGLSIAAAAPGFGQGNEVTPLTDFDATQIEGAWSAGSMLFTDVFGVDGDLIGEVQNIVMTPDSTIDRIVIETDNWLDIGDRAISVAWDQVDLTPGEPGIQVPIDEDQMDDFKLFGNDETTDTGPRNFRASDVISDYVTLNDGANYGYISDLIFDRNGKLSSVMVIPDLGFGPDGYVGRAYAFPFYGYDYGYDPFGPNYGMPYATNQVVQYQPSEVDMMGDGS